MSEADTSDHWEKILESIDLEIARMAIACHIRLLDPGVVERVIDKDELVCSSLNPLAFSKLRALLIMHFMSRQHITQELGATQRESIAAHIREHLRGRIGVQLGGIHVPRDS